MTILKMGSDKLPNVLTLFDMGGDMMAAKIFLTSVLKHLEGGS